VVTSLSGWRAAERELLNAVWGGGKGDAQQYLRVYVGQLRHKLEDDPLRPRQTRSEGRCGLPLRARHVSEAQFDALLHLDSSKQSTPYVAEAPCARYAR
jgi:hypothetical protein